MTTTFDEWIEADSVLVADIASGELSPEAGAAARKALAISTGWLATTNPILAAAVSNAVNTLQASPAELLTWSAGTVTGGYNADGTPSDGVPPHGGYYPVTGEGGAVTYIPSRAKMIADLSLGANVMAPGSAAILAVTPIPEGAAVVRTTGREADGDGGEGEYLVVDDDPDEPGQIDLGGGKFGKLISAPHVVTSMTFGAPQDGVTPDDAAFAAQLAYTPPGGIVRPNAGRTLYLSQRASTTKSVHIDLNGCHVIAPKGIVSVGSTRIDITDAAGIVLFPGDPPTRFVAQEGKLSCDIPLALVGLLQEGDIFQDESNDVAVEAGDYTWGQRNRILKLNPPSEGHPNGEILFARPMNGDYTVHRIKVIDPLDFSIYNGFVDSSGAARALLPGENPVISVVANVDRFFARDLQLRGNLDAGAGINFLAMDASINDCRADYYLNQYGIPSGGRLGYGISGAADVLNIRRSGGSRCKHVISLSSRVLVTEEANVIDCWATSPKGVLANTPPLIDGSGAQPLYQDMIDCHANTRDLKIIRPRTDGINSHIAIRNGHATIENPIMLSRGVMTAFRQDYLINIREAPLRRLTVRDVELYVDPLEAGQVAPSLVGIQQYWAGAHGVVDVRGVRATGGRLFTLEGNAGDPAVSAALSIDEVSITDVHGDIAGGVKITGVSAVNALGAVGKITVTGDYKLAASAQPPGASPLPAVYVIYAASVGQLVAKGLIDGSELTSGLAAVHIGDAAHGMVLPQWMDFGGLKVQAQTMGFAFGSNSATPAGGARFNDLDLVHNLAHGGFSPGVYFSSATSPSLPWTFGGARIADDNPGAADGDSCENVRATGGQNFDLSGATLSRDPGVSFARAFPGLTKVGSADIKIRSSTPNIYQDSVGELRADTKPTTGAFPVGSRCYPRVGVKGSAEHWTYLASGGWTTTGFILLTQATGAAPVSVPTEVGLEIIDTVSKRLYRAMGTASAADWIEVEELSSADNLIAHAGGGQASALALTARVNRVATVATAADSVKLPVSTPGRIVHVINDGANAMQVFGTGADTINGVASGVGVSLAVGKAAVFTCPVAGKWFGGALS